MSSNNQSGRISVTLTSEIAGFVREQTRSGKYASASEVVQEALQLLEAAERIRAERLRDVKDKVAEGLASLDRGEGRDGESVFRELEESFSPRGKSARR
jgi:antitoxin ParD1/3/4